MVTFAKFVSANTATTSALKKDSL